MNYTADLKKLSRHFLPEDFSVTDWNKLEPYFQSLLVRKIDSIENLEQWLKDISELEAALSEDACWRQIKMTCDTENKKLEAAFVFFMMEIQPKAQPFADKLNKKLLDNPFTKELEQDKFFTYLRTVKKNIGIFREENIPLLAELGVMQQQYGTISGKMTVEVDGKEYTLAQATKFLENNDRTLRESVYRKINDRRIEDKDELNSLFSNLIEKRNAIAQNAGFVNYCDYKFVEMGRFDYTKEDCFQFHKAVKQHVIPLLDKIYEKKKKKLGLDSLKPWDVEAHPADEKQLHPFKNGDELVEKTIDCFNTLNPFFGDCLRKMNAMGHLDLDSRKGKAPGGYNCPLFESGAPFIFMNAAGQMDDVITMVHEGGHAIHSFLVHPLELSGFKEYPMEIAEVASMAMELFSMDSWNVFFNTEEELNQAKEHQLERIISIFPWIATIDKFQHWIYENPDHNLEQRADKWMEILNEYSSSVLDTSGIEEYRRYSWQKQLHLFEVPFYYIEYGIAQLGAIGLWKQFREDKNAAISNYIKTLALGGTKALPELFNTANLNFDFSPKLVGELMSFVHTELVQITNPQ